MCDTVVAVLGGGGSSPRILFAKNSDREPGEAQVVEHHPPRTSGGRVRCTHVDIEDVGRTHEIVISRPAWMWGAEMGANDRGLVIGNEAVFTRLPVPEIGLTGMDLARLALERAATAREAIDVITSLARRHGQGGRMGRRKRWMRYFSSFLVADPGEAWVLETAGPFFAARRVRDGVRSISNALSIGADFDLVADGALAHARRARSCRPGEELDFARCFGDHVIAPFVGARARAARTRAALVAAGAGADLATLRAALRDHAGRAPADGLVMAMPCAHASYLPTRSSGQTTGSMACELDGAGHRYFFTGTSSPCLSAFKPVPLGAGPVDLGPPPGERWDGASLWWRHEVVHRRALAAWPQAVATVRADLDPLEARAAAAPGGDAGAAAALWAEHRELARELGGRLAPRRGARSASPFSLYWSLQDRRDGVPA